jgi:peptide/nickel transport system substrate-binding protein
MRRPTRYAVTFLIAALPLVAVLAPTGAGTASAAPEGTLTIATHFTPVTRWLDAAEGESTITPFFLLYTLHDGLLKPMPGVGSGPSLAESWSMSKDMLTADFTLRANAKFHNGEPVTSEDVKFSFERYRGGAAKVLKDAVKEIQTPAPNRVRFVFKEPWPDFSAFYGTFVASAGSVVPKNQIVQAPVYHLGFPIGVGPRVEDIMATAIPGFYMSPYEDLKLRRP